MEVSQGQPLPHQAEGSGAVEERIEGWRRFAGLQGEEGVGPMIIKERAGGRQVDSVRPGC